MPRVAEPAHAQAAARVREHIAVHEQKRDLVALGAYVPGSDRRLDAALARNDRIEAFLRQDSGTACAFEDTLRALHALV
jgi:flagellar biosynthesis/type III secretory pathway ATPase